MERNLESLKLRVGDSVLSAAHATSSRCNSCGKSFDTPLLALVVSDYLMKEYYACPSCLSKVRSVERPKPVQIEMDIANAKKEAVGDNFGVEVEDTMKKNVVEAAAGCGHHFGYLKQRPKNTAIPEECLTCSKMMECMY